MKKRNIFIGIAVFWLLVIGGFVAIQEYTLNNGTEVILATIPVDPYDLFRGDYVILKYDISEMQVPPAGYDPGDYVYVKLEEELPVGLTKAIGISKEKPTGLFLKGRIIETRDMYDDKDVILATIEYGIESYFVPEGRGQELEALIGNELTVKASISNGKAIIKELLKNGEPILFNKPF